MKSHVFRSFSLLSFILLLASCSSGIQRDPPVLGDIAALATETRNVTFQVKAISDDAEEPNSQAAATASTVLEIGVNNGNARTIGLRFQGVTIPKGAQISSATLEFVASAGDSGSASFTVAGHATDNASVFTTGVNNIASRPKTSATYTWQPTTWTSGGAYKTGNIANVIQQIVSRSGWQSGNAMSFIVTGTGVRKAVAFESNAAKAPRLVVTYTTGTPPPPPPPPNPCGSLSGTLPAPWQSADLGTVSAAGKAASTSDTFDLCGYDSGLGTTTDSFHFVHQTLTGDGTLTARVVSLDATTADAQAGVMVRETLDAGSRYASVTLAGANQTAFASRGGTAPASITSALAAFADRAEPSPTTSVADLLSAVQDVAGSLTPQAAQLTAPYWVRITRKGDSLNGYTSSDGQTWQAAGTATVAMAQQVYVGLTSTGKGNAAPATVRFDNVTVGPVTGEPDPQAFYDAYLQLTPTQVEEVANILDRAIENDLSITQEELNSIAYTEVVSRGGNTAQQLDALQFDPGDPLDLFNDTEETYVQFEVIYGNYAFLARMASLRQDAIRAEKAVSVNNGGALPNSEPILDTFRHTFWNVLMASRLHPDLFTSNQAEKWANLHESIRPDGTVDLESRYSHYPNLAPPRDSPYWDDFVAWTEMNAIMDLASNAYGRNLALDTFSDQYRAKPWLQQSDLAAMAAFVAKDILKGNQEYLTIDKNADPNNPPSFSDPRSYCGYVYEVENGRDFWCLVSVNEHPDFPRTTSTLEVWPKAWLDRPGVVRVESSVRLEEADKENPLESWTHRLAGEPQHTYTVSPDVLYIARAEAFDGRGRLVACDEYTFAMASGDHMLWDPRDVIDDIIEFNKNNESVKKVSGSAMRYRSSGNDCVYFSQSQTSPFPYSFVRNGGTHHIVDFNHILFTERIVHGPLTKIRVWFSNGNYVTFSASSLGDNGGIGPGNTSQRATISWAALGLGCDDAPRKITEANGEQYNSSPFLLLGAPYSEFELEGGVYSPPKGVEIATYEELGISQTLYETYRDTICGVEVYEVVVPSLHWTSYYGPVTVVPPSETQTFDMSNLLLSLNDTDTVIGTTAPGTELWIIHHDNTAFTTFNWLWYLLFQTADELAAWIAGGSYNLQFGNTSAGSW